MAFTFLQIPIDFVVQYNKNIMFYVFVGEVDVWKYSNGYFLKYFSLENVLK
jgi:hypothetical protein